MMIVFNNSEEKRVDGAALNQLQCKSHELLDKLKKIEKDEAMLGWDLIRVYQIIPCFEEVIVFYVICQSPR